MHAAENNDGPLNLSILHSTSSYAADDEWAFVRFYTRIPRAKTDAKLRARIHAFGEETDACRCTRFLMQNSLSQTRNILGRVEQCRAYDPSRLHYIRKPVLRVISFATQFARAPAHLSFLLSSLFFFSFNKLRPTATYFCSRARSSSRAKPNFRELLILRGHVRPIVRSVLVTPRSSRGPPHARIIARSAPAWSLLPSKT